MKKFLNIFGRLLILLVFLGAAWLLYERLKRFTFRQIYESLVGIPLSHIVIAALLTVINYLILVGYDWFAVRWVGEKNLSLRKIALASFTGYAFSYNFGSTLFGTSIRYRLYSAWGVSLVKILELLVILGLTFWFGLFTLAGIVFIAAPFPIPDSINIPKTLQSLFRLPETLPLPFTNMHWVGIVLLLIAMGYVLLSAIHRKPFKIFRWHIPLPPLKLTFYQIVIACGDLLVAAAIFYSVLPPIEGGYIKVLGVFMLAFVAGVLTHVPGGYGVFEAFIMGFLPATPDQGAAIFAAIIAFRVIWNWIPLLIAAIMLGCNEWALTKASKKQKATDTQPPGSG
jgi:phosphatidylglycerol lysyltransferase